MIDVNLYGKMDYLNEHIELEIFRFLVLHNEKRNCIQRQIRYGESNKTTFSESSGTDRSIGTSSEKFEKAEFTLTVEDKEFSVINW